MRYLGLGLILCAAVSLAPAAEQKKEKKGDAPKPVEGERVYTQADLERVIQAAKDAPVTPLPPAQPPTQTALPAPAAKPAPPAKASPAAPASFSNDDLERMFGKVEEKPAGPGESAREGLPKLPDPLAEVADWQAQRTAAERRRDESTARVQQLEGQIRDLEQRAVAVRNPLLPRPAPPAGMEGGWEKLNGAERVAALETRMAALRDQLATARQDAARAEADVQAAGAGRSEKDGD